MAEQIFGLLDDHRHAAAAGGRSNIEHRQHRFEIQPAAIVQQLIVSSRRARLASGWRTSGFVFGRLPYFALFQMVSVCVPFCGGAAVRLD